MSKNKKLSHPVYEKTIPIRKIDKMKMTVIKRNHFSDYWISGNLKTTEVINGNVTGKRKNSRLSLFLRAACNNKYMEVAENEI